MKKIICSFALCGVLLTSCICVSSCASNKVDGNSIDSLPDDVKTVVSDYLDAYEEGVATSVNYMHFENDSDREAYLNTNDTLESYDFISWEKINDDLYSIILEVTTTQRSLIMEGADGNAQIEVFNFVGRINGQWYYINNVVNIPTSIQENLDVDDYSYDDSLNVLDPENTQIAS